MFEKGLQNVLRMLEKSVEIRWHGGLGVCCRSLGDPTASQANQTARHQTCLVWPLVWRMGLGLVASLAS
jgi:hypothetical protein